MALSYTSNYVRDINQKLSVSYKYGDGFPVLKELIQNADDASANELRIYVVDGIKNARTSLLRQPAIIVFNDGEFTKEHLKNILTMSVDSKTTDKSKIGRYGLGMKSIFHICDAFIFAICKKPDFADIKVDCISPWAPNDPDHDYLDFPNEEEKKLIIQNLPFDLKKEKNNGFVLYLPIQEPGKPHVIQEHKISKDRPFGYIDDVLRNIGTTLPLLYEVSPSKTLKEIKYYITEKDCRNVSIGKKNKTVITESEGKKVEEYYCVYNAEVHKETLSKFIELTKNENWNQREEKKEIKPEITFELIRNDGKNKELAFKYCVYLPMEEPKIVPVTINTKNGFTVLVHGNYAIDSGRRGFIGFSTLLNNQSDTVIEGTDSLQIMWNKILAQEIMFPEFPKFLEHCVNEGLLVFNKSVDEVSEFLNSFEKINFETLPFVNQYTCSKYCFGKVVTFRKGHFDIKWCSFESKKNLIKLPEISDFTKVLELMPIIDTVDCIYLSHNESQFQIVPVEYNPNIQVLMSLICSLSEKVVTDINLCKWFKSFLLLNKKAFIDSDELRQSLIKKIKDIFIQCELKNLSGNSKNLGELLTYVNYLSGNTRKKFFAVNIQDESRWKYIWNEDEEFVLVPSFLTVEENYIEDDFVINPDNSICQYLQNSTSIPAESHYEILQKIIGKKRFENLFQKIADTFESLSIFRIKDIKTNIYETATRSRLNSLDEQGLLFYFTSDFKETAPIKLYSRLIESLHIYSISKSDIFADERILSPDEPKDIFASFQLQDYRNIEYDKKFLADFLEKMFDYPYTISEESADFYRFLFSDCNKNLSDEDICFNNSNEIWKRIYKHIKPNTIFIPDNFREHTRNQISENEKKLHIFPLTPEHCIKEMADSFNLDFFKEDHFFHKPENQEILFKEFQESQEFSKEFLKELYLRIPLQFDSITKQIVAPKGKTCYLNINEITVPKELVPNFYLIEPSKNQLLEAKQKIFLIKLEYKKAIESFIALGEKNNIDVFDEVFTMLSHIEEWETFSDPGACGCAMMKWIPVHGQSKSCSVRQIIDDNIFSEPVRKYLISNFSLYSREEVGLSYDKFQKMHTRKMFPTTYERLFECFVEPFSEKMDFKIQFDSFEEFYSSCRILKDFDDVPVYGAMIRLLDECNTNNSRDLLFALYKKIVINGNIEKEKQSLNACLKYLCGHQISESCVNLFKKTLARLISLDKENFDIRQYNFPVQNNIWKNPSEIAATNDEDYEKEYLLKQTVYTLLEESGMIKTDNEKGVSENSELEYKLSSDDSIESIRKAFSPWFESENLEHQKLIYMFFLLLQGNFSKFALEEKNISYFDSLIKEYQINIDDPDSTIWINNVPESEIFTSFDHFKTIIHIPKGSTVPLLNLIGEKIPVPQSNSENPNTLFRDRAWMTHPNAEANVFHLELKKITATVHDLDRKLQELIESQVLRFGYRQLFNKEGYRLFTAFLETNQNTVKSTVLYIFDSLFDKLSGMGLKSNKDFKELYSQYSEIFTRQTSLENEKFQSFEKGKREEKQQKIYNDKKNLNEKLKDLILTNSEMQKDLHAAVKKQISKNQYSVSRILYELLQNADDAVCDISDSQTFKNRRQFSIIIRNGTFIVSHYGRRINETPAGINHSDKYQYDLKNMLALNASDKDENDIGQFGLGFKSIYLASNEPVLRSGELQFKIIGALYPKKLDYEEKLNDFETRIEFKITEENIAINDLLSDFKKTASIQPLLCRGINQISICNEDDGKSEDIYSVQGEQNIVDTPYGKVKMVILDGQKYLVIEGKDNLYKIIFKEQNGQVEIFKSASKEHMPRIWNLAPFAEYENLPFIINASFDLDPGRTSLSKVDNKNKILLDKISDSVSQLLVNLYDNDNSGEMFNSLLHVFLYTTNSPEKLFSDFSKRILKLIADERNIIPTGARTVIDSSASICSITANTFGLKPENREFITVLNTIQDVFGDAKYIVSNVVKEAFEKQWKQIDSYETLLLLFSELHDSVLDNACIEGFLEVKNNTDHDEDINWNKFKLKNINGIPKTVNSFSFSNSDSDEFEIINAEYSEEVFEFFAKQEFAKNNEISEKNIKIEEQRQSIVLLSSERDRLREAIRTGNFAGLDLGDNDVQDMDFDKQIMMQNSLSSFSWKNEYFRLIRDVRLFMKEKRSPISKDELYGNKSNLADISNFGQEKSIWESLKEQQKFITSSETSKTPINTDSWKQFLTSSYKGRCQLCGERTATGIQDSYSWTFRIVKESDNRLANIKSNILCLCPTCHGKMGYGRALGKDLTSVVEAAEKYSSFLEEQIGDPDIADENPPFVKEFANEEIDIPGFINPIVFDVTVNGNTESKIVFSWEHFLRLAFIFSHLNDFDENELIEPENFTNYYYGNWHGTEWVTGHYRTRNGQTEYVRGHWRTR